MDLRQYFPCGEAVRRFSARRLGSSSGCGVFGCPGVDAWKILGFRQSHKRWVDSIERCVEISLARQAQRRFLSGSWAASFWVCCASIQWAVRRSSGRRRCIDLPVAESGSVIPDSACSDFSLRCRLCVVFHRLCVVFQRTRNFLQR
ncbi:hypothetical protein NDU88_001580 [Pleurodeles waltl]|uniref:Uncharacterized protein n=1 Tax=Pleurodeles waltl TaxID=8319 RepID=A0AAV7P787_PLEWA|nr:hypothetical protein NDU88_001580 [Pleurodeles waltl]